MCPCFIYNDLNRRTVQKLAWGVPVRMVRRNHLRPLAVLISFALFVDSAVSAQTKREISRSVSSEIMHIQANFCGNRSMNTIVRIEDSSQSSSESTRRNISCSASRDHYPSPDGKDSRWRFDLRHTVEPEPRRHNLDKVATIQGSSNALVLRGTFLRAPML